MGSHKTGDDHFSHGPLSPPPILHPIATQWSEWAEMALFQQKKLHLDVLNHPFYSNIPQLHPNRLHKHIGIIRFLWDMHCTDIGVGINVWSRDHDIAMTSLMTKLWKVTKFQFQNISRAFRLICDLQSGFQCFAENMTISRSSEISGLIWSNEVIWFIWSFALTSQNKAYKEMWHF